MLALITLFICGFFGYSLGKMSNGMTSPRAAFNIYTAPFAAVIGALIGLLSTIFAGSIGSNVLWGLFIGAVAGGFGLVVARAQR